MDEKRDTLLRKLETAREKLRELDVRVAAGISREHRMAQRLAVAERLSEDAVLLAGVPRMVESPIAYALLRLEYLQREIDTQLEPGGPVHQRLLPSLIEAAEHLRQTRELLAQLPRVDAGATTTDLRRVLLTSIKMARVLVEHDAAVVPVLDDAPPLSGSEGVLTTIFVALLVNAAESLSADGPGDKLIRVSGYDAGSDAFAVEITDSGCGIAEENLGRIFDPFFTTKPASRNAGLGLTVCRKLIHALGGTIEVTSRAGIGTTVLVRLPRARERHEPTSEGGLFSSSKPPVRRLRRE